MQQKKAKASFFFTGRIYRNPSLKKLIARLKKDGHYLGAHSDQHLLYCDWTKRDSLLVTHDQFNKDLLDNYAEMKKFGVQPADARYFLPAYEWFNDSIAAWTSQLGFTLVNFTPGTLSHADYTTPDLKNYRSSQVIYQSITGYEGRSASGLNGFILLVHIGTDPKRTDKFYEKLPALIDWLQQKKYRLVRVNDLLK